MEEEYDADIQFHFRKFKNGLLEVTSDIDDQIDYLEPMERTTIIISMLNDLFEQIIKDIDNVDADVEPDIYDDILSRSAETRDAIIQAILNLHYNSYAKHCHKEPMLLEFAIAIYEAMYNRLTKDQYNIVSNTTYSTNICNLEPMNGALAFELDTAECLLDGGIDKKTVKTIMMYMLKEQIKSIDNFINDYEEDDK